MYVCICNALNERSVKMAAANGAGSVGSVFKTHGCRPQCGRCLSHMRSMLEESRGSDGFSGAGLGGKTPAGAG